MAIYTKFCTYKNIPLYGMSTPSLTQCLSVPIIILRIPTGQLMYYTSTHPQTLCLSIHIRRHDIDCVRFSCYSPIASTSIAAPQLRPLQLLLPNCRYPSTAPRSRPPQLLLPDRIWLSCCSPNAYASTAAPLSTPLHLLMGPLQLLLSGCVCLQPHPFWIVLAPVQHSWSFFAVRNSEVAVKGCAPPV